jgi:hypothetical protein
MPVFLAAATIVAGCGSQPVSKVDPAVHVAAASPPSPATWPRYPRYPSSSCWTRPFGGGPPLQTAPSYPVPKTHTPVAQKTIVRRLLRRLGDRRYVRNVELGSPPRITLEHLRGYYAGARPPANAVWAYVAATPGRVGAQMIAEWEADLVVGALRDDFCAAGGAPLVGWTIGRGGIGISDRPQALEQRFPNPTPAAFESRVKLVGRRYGFEVEELRLLRPRQLAPLLIVRTGRNRKAFVKDVTAIMALLDPRSNDERHSAETFEGFFFEADDSRGPFVRVERESRGQSEGGEWSWNPCVEPYPHSEPAGRSC